MKTISLSKGYHAIVDDEDYELITSHKWYASKSDTKMYAKHKATTGNPSGLMHREILGLTDSTKRVDHINGNGLDNRKSNLRICNNTQNSWNSNKRMSKRNTSKYKGVSLDGNRWNARITINGTLTRLGGYVNETDAALAYNEAAIKYFGDFAHLNELPSTSISIAA